MTLISNDSQPWQIKMLYDGQCPICKREVGMIGRQNQAGRIAFEDITTPEFDPSKYGLTMPQVIGSMHAIRPDGSILRGVDVFAEVYDAIGWKWIPRLLRWRVTRPLAKVGYRVFAAIRPRISRFDRASCTTSCSTPITSKASGRLH